MSGYTWREALARMKGAELDLTNSADEAERDDMVNERARLLAKREGVRLARSYLEEVEE